MFIAYSDHAKMRMKQRGVTECEIDHILMHPDYIKKSFGGRREAAGMVKSRLIKVDFVEGENYIKIITVI